MSDFGEMSKVANEQLERAMGLIEAPLKSYENTFQDHRKLVLNFPAEPLFAPDMAGVDRAYKFDWEVVESRRYRTAYFSFIRATAKSTKDVRSKTMEDVVQKGAKNFDHAEKSKKKNKQPTLVQPTTGTVKSLLRDQVEKAMVERYTEKFNAILASKTNTAVIDSGRRDALLVALQSKYGIALTKLDVTGDLVTGSSVAAKKVAAHILAKRDGEFEAKYEKYKQKTLESRIRTQIKGMHPDATDEYINNKLAKKVSAAVSSKWHRSVVIAFEVSYNVLKINEGDVKSRWRKLEMAIKHQKAEETRAIDKSIKEIYKDLKRHKELGDDYDDDGSGLADLKGRLVAQKAEFKEIEDRYKGYWDDLAAEKLKVAKIVEEKRAIGNFIVTPAGSAGELATGISWRNTNAEFTARCVKQADGAIAVLMDFAETSFGDLPKLGNILGNEYTTVGGLTFRADGEVEPDGKIGKRCMENLQATTGAGKK